MLRRNFLRNSSVVGFAFSAIPAAAIIPDIHERKENRIPADDFALNEITIDELQAKMKNGALTSHAVVQMYLDRIEKIDRSGPLLNAVIEINPDALAIADAMDAERKNGKVRSPLHGIPVLIKDNIDTADKMATSAGSLALKNHHAEKDAFLVMKLRDAGAVILGKTNLSEWANFRSEKSTSGWSSRGGQTKNPYVLERNPLGSSAGSGVAVAANLCTVAIGTETDGSIVCPSSVNGIVGIKPTVGLISRSGIIPISKTQDTAGPMARTVKDAAVLLSVLYGSDTNDVATSESDQKGNKDYTKFLDGSGLKGKRIGIEKKWESSNEKINDLFRNAIEIMKKQGAVFVEIEYAEKISAMGQDEFAVLEYEFKDGLNAYLSRTNAESKSLKDLIAFNQKFAEQTMPYFGQDILKPPKQKAI